jgi:hypothetical protein
MLYGCPGQVQRDGKTSFGSEAHGRSARRGKGGDGGPTESSLAADTEGARTPSPRSELAGGRGKHGSAGGDEGHRARVRAVARLELRRIPVPSCHDGSPAWVVHLLRHGAEHRLRTVTTSARVPQTRATPGYPKRQAPGKPGDRRLDGKRPHLQAACCLLARTPPGRGTGGRSSRTDAVTARAAAGTDPAAWPARNDP